MNQKGIAPLIIVAIVVVAVVAGVGIYATTHGGSGEGGGTGGGTTPGQDNSGTTPFFGSAPDVTVNLSVPDAYLGDYPPATFTVTNTGDPCTVSYTIFQTAPQTGSFSLGKGESKTVNVTGLQVRDIGTGSPSVQITASNSYGSDTAQASTSFNVDVKPFDATLYIDSNELSSARNGVMRALREAWRWLQSLLSPYRADAYTQFITPDSQTIKMIANQLSSRHPYDSELRAKEIYYWLIDWVSYDYEHMSEWYLQATYPVETIADQTGICINYSMTLASLYEAVGLDTKLVVLWGGQPYGHAIILLYYPNLDYAYYPFNDGWMALDPTNCSVFGEYNPYGYTDWDTVSI